MDAPANEVFMVWTQAFPLKLGWQSRAYARLRLQCCSIRDIPLFFPGGGRKSRTAPPPNPQPGKLSKSVVVLFGWDGLLAKLQADRRVILAESLYISREILNTSATAALLQFGMRNQITFGGLPHNTLRSWKSESFETIVKPCDLAYSHTSESLALLNPQCFTWMEPGYTPDKSSGSWGERFRQKAVSRFKQFYFAFSVGGIRETGKNVLLRQVWKIFQNLSVAHSTGKHIQHFIHSDAQPAHTGSAAALPRFNRNDIFVFHSHTLSQI